MEIIFAVLYSIVVSIGKVSLKKSLSSAPASISFLFETFFGLFLWLPLALTTGIQLSNVISILPVVFIGAVLSEAYIFYIYSKGDLSIIGTIFPSYAIYTIVFSRLFLKESLSTEELSFVLITLVGTFTIAFQTSIKKFFSQAPPILWAMSGAIAVGFADSLGKGAINNTSSATFLFTLGIVQIPVAIAFLHLEKRTLKNGLVILQDFRQHTATLLSAFLIALAQLFFWIAFGYERASIVSPLTGGSIIFTPILSWLFLNEKITPKNALGISLVIIGILGISFV